MSATHSSKWGCRRCDYRLRILVARWGQVVRKVGGIFTGGEAVLILVG